MMSFEIRQKVINAHNLGMSVQDICRFLPIETGCCI